MLFTTRLRMCIKHHAQLATPGNSRSCPASSLIILSLLVALLHVIDIICKEISRYSLSYSFHCTLSLIPNSFTTFTSVTARLTPECNCTHSTMSNRRLSATPLVSKCMVRAMYAWPLGEVHTSVTMFKALSWSCTSWLGLIQQEKISSPNHLQHCCQPGMYTYKYVLHISSNSVWWWQLIFRLPGLHQHAEAVIIHNRKWLLALHNPFNDFNPRLVACQWGILIISYQGM